MNRIATIATVLATTLLLSACQPANGGRDEDAAAEAEPAALPPAPTTPDDAAWRAWLGPVIGQHMDGITERTFNYYLPAGSDPAEVDGPFQRMKTDVNMAVLRTVLPGNMLTFSSPDSAVMADLVVAAFQGEGVQNDALRGTRVLFIGRAEDEARVRAAVEAVGGEFRFHEVR